MKSRTLASWVAVVALAATGACKPGPPGTPRPAERSGAELVVANIGSDEILFFEIQSDGKLGTTPFRTIAGPATLLDDPYDVALDSAGRVYALNQSRTGGTPRVTIYAAEATGNVAPVGQVSGPNAAFRTPRGIAVGEPGPGGGRIIVANWDAPGQPSNILQFPFSAGPGDIASSDVTVLARLAAVPAYGVTHKPAGGRIFVPTGTGNSILIFSNVPAQNADPSARITGGNTQLNLPTRVDLDGSGNLYVLNRGEKSVLVFDGPIPRPGVSDISPRVKVGGPGTTLLSEPEALGVTPQGSLYVGDGNSIKVFANIADNFVLAQTVPNLNIPSGLVVNCGIRGCTPPAVR